MQYQHSKAASSDSNSQARWLGVDTGGTFTDFVYYEQGQLRIHKVLSTPAAPEQAILQGLKELGLDTALSHLSIVHGSTVATNAVLEKKGVKTVYITNKGLADVLTIGRQARQQLYNLTPIPQQPPVPAALCFEVSARVDADGRIRQSLKSEELQQLLDFIQQHQPQAVAINLLFSFLDAQDELRLEQCLRQNFPELFISRSSEVLAEYKEYERGMATWLNAWVGPLVQGYLMRLSKAIAPACLTVMQSSGGTIAADKAAANAVRMLLSGPAGGLAGARYIASLLSAHELAGELAGFDSQQALLTFDMGGTSTDVALIEGDLQLTNEGCIGDYPVAVSMVDMHTIGAGGGSIASVDAGGILQVGPESAGASPGPACYGAGGMQATVTDANLLLGHLSDTVLLGGSMPLDRNASIKVMSGLARQLSLLAEGADQQQRDEAIGQTALGIIQVANEHMSRALRVMSIQRGIDPKTLILVPFGGAGALHVCALADNLRMSRAMVPLHAGVLSAFGMVLAPRSRDLSQTINRLLEQLGEQQLKAQFDLLAEKGLAELVSEGMKAEDIACQYSVDLRYFGQSYTLNLAWSGLSEIAQDFHDLHLQRYGHQHEQPVELVNIRLKVSVSPVSLVLPKLPVAQTALEPVAYTVVYGHEQAVPVFRRQDLCFGQRIDGPALIVETVATTWLEADWYCVPDSIGNLLLTRNSTD